MPNNLLMSTGLVLALVVLAGVGGLVLALVTLRQKGYRAVLGPSGYQEARVLVRDRYDPDTIVVRVGEPVRLIFQRQEPSACSSVVEFPDFGRRVRLAEGGEVPVELWPDEPGTYEFTCAEGALRGRLLVEGV